MRAQVLSVVVQAMGLYLTVAGIFLSYLAAFIDTWLLVNEINP
jgi:hypothetical protein